jgi:phosphomannomutase
VDPAIFKAYDVRGLYPEQIDEASALAIGRATARFLGEGPVVVGRDMRESGVALREALTRGLRAEGSPVIDVGRVSTPMVYFAAAEKDAAGGVMVTASHNPGGYNGLKICGRAAVPVGIETGLSRIRDLALELLDAPAPQPRADLERESVSTAYFDSLLETFPEIAALKVVIDCGNGIAGEAIEDLLPRLPLAVTRLYFEPDGSFPNHEANPIVPENLLDLRDAVRESGADLGVAFDGDGDRAVFVDERAEPVPADLMTALLASFVLDHGLLGARDKSPIVYDLRSSHVVPETVRAAGGEAVRCRVGHAFMKERMRANGAPFGGELSGHYYFRFPAGYVADDGAAAMLLLLFVLAQAGRPLSELWTPLRRYAQSGEVNRTVDDVAETLRRVRSAFTGGEADELDGLTVTFADWWFNLRPSNTEPLLRLNVEAGSPEEMAERRDRILAVIEGR